MRTIAGLLLCALALPVLAQRGGDLQARIVYAYQTEDLTALRDLRQTLRRLRQALRIDPQNPRALYLAAKFAILETR